MNKQLLLLRHGEAAYARAGADFERPLTTAGAEDVRLMAGKTADRQIRLAGVFSSPARRAFDTAVLFATGIGLPADGIVTLDEVYEAPVRTLLRTVTSFSDKLSTVILVGHNPGLTELANYLSDAEIYNLPTAGLVMISFPFNEWRLVSQGTGRADFTDSPEAY
ncbi:histidine phosphatase family protein [Pedobacter yulinensis]|uniref:Histidine phosphatase family protein n=1 Tax=Pedobacter yulinensis TaxID=2126353 RepID=A0A2T3HM66_9SPHI|nr:histidine phosphatase family protein [Pedobacter yulinensis]PST83524.1 histidine phosphatase family protein [Pedobacter yulinensis]